MGTYKVIQDIEAEDKLFGPLTLKQFIFACLVMVFGYASFWSLINDLWFLLIFFMPPTLFFAILAFPYSKDQPTEVWLMAKLRFYFQPRRRIWDQDGIKELVTITVPKHEEKIYTDGLSTTQVKSRLRALADTIDTRGWAVKGQAVNLTPYQVQPTSSDRLLSGVSAQQNLPITEIKADDDIYDEVNNPKAKQFDEMIQKHETAHRDEIIEKVSSARNSSGQDNSTDMKPAINGNQSGQLQQQDYWFMRQPSPPTKAGVATFGATPVVMPGQKTPTKSSHDMSEEEKKLLDKIHENQDKPDPMNSHLKTIKPLSQQQAEEKAKATQARKEKNISVQQSVDTNTPADEASSKHTNNPDMLSLAQNNDLNIETIARQANKKPDKSGDDEVVVSLH